MFPPRAITGAITGGVVTALAIVVINYKNDVPHEKALRQAAYEVGRLKTSVEDQAQQISIRGEAKGNRFRLRYTTGAKTRHLLYSDGTVGEALPQGVGPCDNQDPSCKGLDEIYKEIRTTFEKALKEVQGSQNAHGPTIERFLTVPAPPDRRMAIPPSSHPSSVSTAQRKTCG